MRHSDIGGLRMRMRPAALFQRTAVRGVVDATEQWPESRETGADDADGLLDRGPHGCVDGGVEGVVGVGAVEGYDAENGDDADAALH